MATALAREIGYERAEVRSAAPPGSPGPSRRYGIGFWLAAIIAAVARRLLARGPA